MKDRQKLCRKLSVRVKAAAATVRVIHVCKDGGIIASRKPHDLKRIFETEEVHGMPPIFEQRAHTHFLSKIKYGDITLGNRFKRQIRGAWLLHAEHGCGNARTADIGEQSHVALRLIKPGGTDLRIGIHPLTERYAVYE